MFGALPAGATSPPPQPAAKAFRGSLSFRVCGGDLCPDKSVKGPGPRASDAARGPASDTALAKKRLELALAQQEREFFERWPGCLSDLLAGLANPTR